MALVLGWLLDQFARRTTSLLSSGRRFRPPVIPHLPLSRLTVIAVLAIAVGDIASGWPPYYERLPGPFAPGLWERSVDAHETDVAEWFPKWLDPYNRVAADGAQSSLLSGIGLQEPTANAAYFFLWDTPLSSAQVVFLSGFHVHYVVVDDRLATMLPNGGSYFDNDPLANHYLSPLPEGDLSKFANIPGTARIYDDGTIQVYDVKWSVLR